MHQIRLTWLKNHLFHPSDFKTRTEMKTITGILLVVFSCAQLCAQENTQITDSIQPPWTFAAAQKNLKLSPFDVFSAIPTVGADLEVSFIQDMRLQAGAGVILPGIQLMGNNGGSFDKMGGYRLRAESRFFIFKKPTRYFATELSFRHLIIRDEVGIGMEPS